MPAPVSTLSRQGTSFTPAQIRASRLAPRSAGALVSPSASGVVPLANAPVHFSTDPNSIVTVNVSTVEAPTPNTYQQCGCFVSFGATNLPAQDCAELTQWSDLTTVPPGSPTGTLPIVIQPAAITSATWSAGVVTITTTNPLPASYTVGDNPNMLIAGFTPVGYNGMFVATITGPDTFTYPLTTDPTTAVTMGTWQPMGAVELSQMVTTYFSQGNMVSVWVLELGEGLSASANAAALQTWLTNNPLSFYGYLLPREVGANTTNLTAFEPVFKQYQNPNAMTYFWITVVQATMTQLGPTYKDVIQFIEAPTLTDPAGTNLTLTDGEFSQAAMFYAALAFRPSQVNRVAPMAFKYLYGVTPYPSKGNGPLLKSFKTNFTNYVTTGAEGGISKTIVYQGVTLDGYDYFNWWWTIDWVSINVNLDLSNAIINGSNNPLAPLYYDQPGIDFLESTLGATMRAASAFGMVVGPIVLTNYDQPSLSNAIQQSQFEGQCDVNAVPFISYTRANPGDFKIGEYDGLSVVFIPARGFIHILVQIIATSLVSV